MTSAPVTSLIPTAHLKALKTLGIGDPGLAWTCAPWLFSFHLYGEFGPPSSSEVGRGLLQVGEPHPGALSLLI